MAAGSNKGKFFLFCLFIASDFLHSSWVYADSNSESSSSPVIENKNEGKYESITDPLDVLNRHQVQLEKLEGLVKDLSELVVRLESRLSDYPEAKTSDSVKPSFGKWSKNDFDEKSLDSVKPSFGKWSKNDFGEKSAGKVRDIDLGLEKTGEKVGAVSVTKYSPFWSEKFQFVSAVRLDSDATCINVLPFRDFDGFSKYVVVGDARGQLYVFSRNGDVLIEFNTFLDAPITALVSFLTLYKNESVLVTGHENGVILKHRVWEVVQNGEEWPLLRMESVRKFASPGIGEGGSSITNLEVHHMGRNRYVLSTDFNGNLRVFRENGSVYGLAVPKSKPLAFLKQRLLFLTETGAGSLDLRTMRIRESECEGLNNSVAKSYVFDAIEWSKAYGFTSDGDMIHVLLLGDIMTFKCRVRSKKKLEIGMNEPLTFQAIKGYLFISNLEKIWVYNVSSQHYVRSGGPKLVSTTLLDEITNSFLNHQSLDLKPEKRPLIPVLASDREKLVILGTGSGYIGIFRSNLPVFKNEFNTVLWTSPVLFFVLFLFGAWHFFANKKEALTSWGPDDPFSSTSVTDGALLGPGKGDVSFADSSRSSADIMDLRNSGLRGSSGRFASQPQYQSGSTTPYRPSATPDTNSRPVDPNFRAAQELKYRGTNLDSAGFPKRRESLFGNNQVVDDSS